MRMYPILLPQPNLYRNLEMVEDWIQPGSVLKSEDILTSRTTFWAKAFGLSAPQVETIRKQFVDRGATPIKGTRWESHALKYCPQCVKEDEARHGMAHWRRNHQPKTVYACTTHKCRLRVAFNSVAKKLILPPSGTTSVPASPEEIQHAKTVICILNGLWIEPDKIRRRLWEALETRGRADFGGVRHELNHVAVQAWLDEQHADFAAEMEMNPLTLKKNMSLFKLTAGTDRTGRKALATLLLAGATPEELAATEQRRPTAYPCHNLLAPCYLTASAKPIRRFNKSTHLRCATNIP